MRERHQFAGDVAHRLEGDLGVALPCEPSKALRRSAGLHTNGAMLITSLGTCEAEWPVAVTYHNFYSGQKRPCIQQTAAGSLARATWSGRRRRPGG